MNDRFALVRDRELRDYIEALYDVIASEDRDEEPYCTLTAGRGISRRAA
jgi:hypothetical protein